MKKDTLEIKPTYIILASMTALVIGVLVVKKLRNKKERNKNLKQLTKSGSFCQKNEYPLRYGSCGTGVKTLQSFLLAKGYDLGNSGIKGNGVDGKMGNKTLSALKKHKGKTTLSKTQLSQLLS